MKIKASDIYPTQNFLKAGTVKFIFECIRNGKLDNLPPAPIVVKSKEGKLLAVDGHNLIAVKHFRGEELEIQIAQSAEDGLIGDRKGEVERNAELKEKYDKAISMREQTIADGVLTFEDLIDKQRELF